MRFYEFSVLNFIPGMKDLLKNVPGTDDTSADTTSGSNADTSAIKDPNFDKKLQKIADKLGVDVKDLRSIIKTESNFDPKARNKIAGGLIGFTDKTARSLGTSLNDILKMDAVQQLDYAYLFWKKVGVKPGMKRGDIYMLTFMPAYANAPDQTVLGKKNGGQLGSTGLSMHAVWAQNPLFGKSKGKNYFTIADVKNTINNVA
jgi:Transglycosylase SLT domain